MFAFPPVAAPGLLLWTWIIGIVPYLSLQAALTARRQQRSGAMRLQPLAAAPQPIPAAILDRRSKPQGVAHLRFQRGSPHKVRFRGVRGLMFLRRS